MSIANQERNTIAAVSTGNTNSGIGIVRISGEDAVSLADRVYRGKICPSDVPTHTIHYGHIVDKDGKVLDEVLLTVMHAPHTFTGEDVVEINCHGGLYVVNRVLETVIEAGARPAGPGEFTKRAFLNGKMDLSQAESVMDVISAESEYALQNAVSQLNGSVKTKIKDIRNEIIYNTAFIESAVDDPEHYSLDGYAENLRKISENILKKLDNLIDSAKIGRIMKEGIQTAIIGKTNAGKSSVLNALSGYERAIVTDIEGTTRDSIEEKIHMHDLCLNIIDTAGIRVTDNPIEQLGVERAKKIAQEADVVLYVMDSSVRPDETDAENIRLISQKPFIILLNKSDLVTAAGSPVVRIEDVRAFLQDLFPDTDHEISANSGSLKNVDLKLTGRSGKDSNLGFHDNFFVHVPVLSVSAKEGEGFGELEKILTSMFLEKEISFHEESCISNVRQKLELENARESMKNVIAGIDAGLPEDFFSIDLMDAYTALGRITGDTAGEDLINEIFSRFCTGK